MKFFSLYPRTKRETGFFLIRLCFLYVFLLASIYFVQSKLLYLRVSLDETEAHARAGAYGMKPWPAEGAALRGWMAKVPGKARGTVVYAHGNLGLALWRSCFSRDFNKLGFNILLYEYPGYGPRSGSPAEEALTADLVEVLKKVRAENPGLVLAMGESLGSGVMASALKRAPEAVDGAILCVPWDTLGNVAQNRFWLIPTRLLLRETYDSVANLADFQKPVVILMCGKDMVIPNPLTQRLYESLRGPKRLMVSKEDTHESWLHKRNAAWWPEAIQFIESTCCDNRITARETSAEGTSGTAVRMYP